MSKIILIIFLFACFYGNSQILKKLKKAVQKIEKHSEDLDNIVDESVPSEKPSEEKSKKNGDSQEKEQVQSAPVDLGRFITYKSPNEYFRTIELQSYNGLPRFGLRNDYGVQLKTRTYNSLESEQKLQLRSKFMLDNLSYKNYHGLVALKFLKPHFDNMEREYLITREEISGSLYRNEPNENEYDKLIENNKLFISSRSQEFLRFLAFGLGSKLILKEYFCNSNNHDCNIDKDNLIDEQSRNHKRGAVLRSNGVRSGVDYNWGGRVPSDFQRQKSFTSFVKEHLETLQRWSEGIWPANSVVGYYVQTIYIQDYDFKSGGYWLSLTPSYQSLIFEKYKSAHDYENIFATNDRHKQVLFKIGSEKAEKLMVNSKGMELRDIYAVYKIRKKFDGLVELSAINTSMSQTVPTLLNFTYNLESPTVELYQDLALTTKIGEVSLENPVTKSRF